jgi:sterol desaturase/sphingolipid hydroxylase (fatty acid hydroxylase superfamily)
MWPLHRAHHSAAYMSVRIVYRNNAFYYALMPGLWLSGVLLYLGFGWVDDRAHGPEAWRVQFIYPLLRSRRAGTVLGKGSHRRPEP